MSLLQSIPLPPQQRSWALVALLAGALSGQGVWMQQAPAATPSWNIPGTFAYDTQRSRLVTCTRSSSSTNEMWQWTGQNWVQLAATPPIIPFLLTYDASHDRLVLVNGPSFATFDGSTWSAGSAPLSSPDGIAYDADRGRVVVFQQIGRMSEWDGTAWTGSLATGPGQRVFVALAYDRARQRTVLFGGAFSGTFFNDTWEWDGTTWTQRTPAVSPSPRSQSRMVWHEQMQRIVLFGGASGSARLGDMWSWDGSNWQPVTAAGPPPGRAGHLLGYDPSRNRLVVALGSSSTGPLNDTWEHAWSTPGTAPRDVELIDMDSDGDLDVATANETSDNVGLRTNSGAGTFAAETTVALTAADHAPVALARFDFDDDGSRDDLAVVCQDSSTLVLITNPGSAPAVVSLSVAGLRPTCVACGDLDADPIDDVVVGRAGEPFAGGAGLAVARNGGAAVDLPIPAPHPTRVVKVTLADLDGDGDLDFAAVAQGSTDELLLFAGDGAGAFTFAGALSLPTAGLASGLCCRDFDGGGTNDLAVVLPQLFPPSQSLRVYRRTGTGALAPELFTAGSDIATTGTFAVDLACGDLADGSIPGFLTWTDLAHANAGSGTVTVRHEYTGAGFAASTSPSAGTNPVAVVIGDVNGDRCADLVVANQGTDDVTVVLTTPPALAQSYGTGCGGPTISAVGLPTSGNPAFGVRVSNAQAVAPLLLLFSSGVADVPLPPSPCRVLLANPILQLLAFTNASGQSTTLFAIPNTSSLLAADVYFQGAVFHVPGGAFADTLDISNALRLQIGQ